MDMEDGGVKWKDLTINCLVCIFMKLSLDDLILGVPFVCESWNEASRDPLCWRVLDFQEVDFVPWRKLTVSDLLKFALHRSCRLVVELRFPLSYRVSLEDLLRVSNECPRLKILVLRSMKMEDQAHFPGIVGKWKELEHLEMLSNPYSFPSLARSIGLNCEKFRGLKMAGLRMEDAVAITEHLSKNLKYLNLSRSYMSREALLLIMNSCREIETLIVQRCVGFEVDEEVREKALGIKDFRHEGSKVVDDDYGCEYYFRLCMLPYDRDEYRIGGKILP